MSEENGPLGPDAGPDAEAPRRAASARFDVAKRDDEGLRDALDPATHSLGEALKLSYRILQVGIVALVLMFVFSGFQSVPEGDTGVKTLFGAIAGKDGEEQLSPGLQPFWPYPVGDLVKFPQRHTMRMDREFWPNPIARGRDVARTMQEMLDTADPNAGIRPGSDNSLLTREGDIVHMQLEAEFVVADAVKFLETTSPEQADRIVRTAIRRGAVEAASAMTLVEFTDTRDLVGPSVRENAQRVLDRLDTGLQITSIRALERTAPFAVVKQQFSSRVQTEVIGDLLRESYSEAVSREKLRPATDPRIEGVSAEPGAALRFTAVVEVLPEFTVKPVADLAVERPSAEVSEADIDAMIESMRRQRPDFIAVERAAADGDRVTVD
ncbi:MAG: trigger factor, partial [Phycisphaerales bacterium]